MGLVDHLVHVLLGLADGVEDVVVGQRIGDGILDTDTVALDEQPVVDHGLDVAVKQAVLVVTDLKFKIFIKNIFFLKFTLFTSS